jgi:hypothetical protein
MKNKKDKDLNSYTRLDKLISDEVLEKIVKDDFMTFILLNRILRKVTRIEDSSLQYSRYEKYLPYLPGVSASFDYGCSIMKSSISLSKPISTVEADDLYVARIYFSSIDDSDIQIISKTLPRESAIRVYNKLKEYWDDFESVPSLSELESIALVTGCFVYQN